MSENKVKDVDLGKGALKTIISVMGIDVEECLNVIEKGKAAGWNALSDAETSMRVVCSNF